MRLDRLVLTAARSIVQAYPQLRRLKRRFSGYADDPDNSNHCVTDGLAQLGALRVAGIPVAGATVLEFGCGWLPLIPLLFHLAGADRIVLTDIERLMDAGTVERARTVVARRLAEVAAAFGAEEAALAERLRTAPPFEYQVPWDAHAHPADSVDILVSRAVLEHVPEAQLAAFLRAFHRVLRPGGAMCHVIDNSDHWQHHDEGLSPLAFLAHEERSWRWRLAQVNAQFYQNRLRHSDYARLIGAAGFRILHAAGEPDPGCLRDLSSLSLASRFAGRDPADLAVLSSLYLAEKPSMPAIADQPRS
jgi:SAM-dependent methyltransferase